MYTSGDLTGFHGASKKPRGFVNVLVTFDQKQAK